MIKVEEMGGWYAAKEGRTMRCQSKSLGRLDRFLMKHYTNEEIAFDIGSFIRVKDEKEAEWIWRLEHTEINKSQLQGLSMNFIPQEMWDDAQQELGRAKSQSELREYLVKYQDYIGREEG